MTVVFGSRKRGGIAAATLAPVRVLPLAFSALITFGWIMLALPWSHHDSVGDALGPALFTSVSASTVTGLTDVDTAAYWTTFGHIMILILIQVGGIGIMTIATLLALIVGGRLGLRSRIIAQAETHALTLGDVRGLVRRVAITMFLFEFVLTVVLTLRFRIAYVASWKEAAADGVFYAISAFNNAGFALAPDSLNQYVGDGWLIFPLCFAVFFGAIGFPVLAELYRSWRRPERWTIHTRLTVWGSLLLFVAGTLVFTVIEWGNPNTLGPMSVWDKFVTGVEGGIMPRSGGFSSIDYVDASYESIGITSVMMFIGGGSASTAGGIKITTFLLLGFVILAELRGDPEVMIGNRRIGATTLRQAVTIALLSTGLVVTATLAILALTDHEPAAVLFEVCSAFGTVGLSTGITAGLPDAAKLILIGLMFLGRVGPITVASALTLRRKTLRYHLPEERPIIG